MSQRSRQKSRNKGRQSGARGRSGAASTSVAASVTVSDPASMVSSSHPVSGSTALISQGNAAWRAGRGYRCIQVSESNHPALGEALFLRDDVERVRRSLQGRIDQLTEARESI